MGCVVTFYESLEIMREGGGPVCFCFALEFNCHCCNPLTPRTNNNRNTRNLSPGGIIQSEIGGIHSSM